MIPTAEEFFSKDNGLYTSYSVKNKTGEFTAVCSYDKAIEFAKLHVEAALKEASEKAELTAYEALWELPEGFTELENYVTDDLGNITGIDVQSILNAYPLTNIK